MVNGVLGLSNDNSTQKFYWTSYCKWI